VASPGKHLIGAWWLPAAYFADAYVRRGGWMDGHAGFAYDFLKASYFWEIGLKVHELERSAGRGR